jgi:hypothetical protein
MGACRFADLLPHHVGIAFRRKAITLLTFLTWCISGSRSFFILATLGRGNQGGVNNRALLHGQHIGLWLGRQRFKLLLPEIVLLQQMSECQDRALIRKPVGDQGDADKAAHRCHLNQRILHRCSAQVVPLLLQMDSQQPLRGSQGLHLQRVGYWTLPAAGPGIMRLDQPDQRLPWHNHSLSARKRSRQFLFLAVDCSSSP